MVGKQSYMIDHKRIFNKYLQSSLPWAKLQKIIVMQLISVNYFILEQ